MVGIGLTTSSQNWHFSDRLKCGSTKVYSSPRLPDWPKQRQMLLKGALVPTHLFEYVNVKQKGTLASKDIESAILNFSKAHSQCLILKF